MMKNKLILLSLLISGYIANASSQWHNNWRDHFSYRQCELVSENSNYIAAATRNGLIIYNYTSGETITLSTVNGLSDVEISALSPIDDSKFIIGYENGNIDIIEGNNIVNIPDLKNKQLQGGKKINYITIYNNKAYCSTDFGILVLNLDKTEIADTYYLGINSENLTIHQCAIINNAIYAATDKGLLKANLNDPQIAYYETWINIGKSTQPHYSVSEFNNNIITTVKNSSSSLEILYGEENNWSLFKTTNKLKNLCVSNNELVIAETNNVKKYNANFELIDSFNKYTNTDLSTSYINVGQAIYSNDKHLYLVADKSRGLAIKENDTDSFILPNGPYSNNAFTLHATSQGIYSLAGGLTTEYNNANLRAEFSFFNKNQWSYYRTKQRNDKYLWRDLIRICSDRKDDKTVYMSSWGGGIFIAENTTILHHYNQFNSSLQNIFPNGNQNYVRVGGIATDSEGNIWMSNSSVDYGIVVREAQDTTQWHQFSYETLNKLHSTNQILITKDDYVWVSIPRNEQQGIMVINPNGTLLNNDDDQYRGPISKSSENDPRNAGQLRIWDESLNVITNKVYCIAEDKNGYIWLGTDNGVVVYYRPWAIFRDDYPVASRIKVPRNDGSNLADYLLEKEDVTCITVDGANRKWIGTQKSGIYLVADDGLKTYHSFNTDNSPLPSNYINSIAIDPDNGEVFIATDKGIVSYKGKATEGAEDFGKIYTYPNPVREDYTGDITITGLIKDSNIKITTVSGKLVYETRSLGGKAYWNGKNFQGEKVKTGIYIAYISSEDGLKTETTKIMIVR